MNILMAVNINNIELVKELLKKKSTNVNLTDNHNFTGKIH